jgi:hypothetical protein
MKYFSTEKKNGDQTWEGIENMLTSSASAIPILDRHRTHITYKQTNSVSML